LTPSCPRPHNAYILDESAHLAHPGAANGMTFDETLQRAFETLTDRLRDEIARELQDAAREMAVNARTDREAAVNEVETRARTESERLAEQARNAEQAHKEAEQARTQAEQARTETERDAEARLQLEVAAAEARGREQADAKLREELAQQGHRVQEMIEAAVAASREDVRSADLSASERLIEAVRAMDRERSLSAILDNLASCAGREVARVGLLLARGGELRGWRFIGFGPSFEAAATIVIPHEESGIIAEAIRTGDAISSDTSGALAAPVFAALPGGRESLAVPVTMGGDVIAVLYADQGTGGEDAQRPSALTWPDALEIMARHAARCLEAATAITAVRALTERPASATRLAADHGGAVAVSPTQSDEDDAARRYARLLVSEIKLYHEVDVVAGRRERDLGTRLGVEIARARVLYQQRVPSSVRDHADHFQDELVRTLANGDASLLGQMT
jgi:hypothetical protein